MKDDNYIDEKEFKTLFEKEIKKKEFEKIIKKIVASCFVDFHKMLYDHRNFLRNKY